MFSLVFTRRYSMAHRLMADARSKCAVPHGHNELVTVRLQASATRRLDGVANMVEPFETAKTLWDALAVGSLVLAQEDDPSHGWWEAVILAIHQNTCTLCFRDHPDDGLVKRERHQLALLHPNG